MAQRRVYLVSRQRQAIRRDAARPVGEPRSFSLCCLVLARRDIHEGFDIAPRGAFGVVTRVLAHGEGYEVRFSEPRRLTLRASGDDLEPA